MKRFLVVLFAFIFLSMSGCSVASDGSSSRFLRIHIRANSNTEQDQKIKLLVRDEIVSQLTPILSACESKEESMRVLQGKLSFIRKTAEDVLKQAGFSYGCSVRLAKERFPDRKYGSLILEAGVYDALIVELGRGVGDNWWCVVFPPLCFVGGTENGEGKLVYRSKLVEIINRFFEKDNRR